MITRLPKWGIIPVFFIVIVVTGSGVLRPSFDLVWIVTAALVLGLAYRVWQIRLEVTETEVLVVNFIRSFRIPTDRAVVEPLPKEPGYLTIRDGKEGEPISIGAAPTWRLNIEEIRARLVLSVEGL